jgi:hypothetical protein
MYAQVIIISLSGMIISSSDFVESGADSKLQGLTFQI